MIAGEVHHADTHDRSHYIGPALNTMHVLSGPPTPLQ